MSRSVEHRFDATFGCSPLAARQFGLTQWVVSNVEVRVSEGNSGGGCRPTCISPATLDTLSSEVRNLCPGSHFGWQRASKLGSTPRDVTSAIDDLTRGAYDKLRRPGGESE